MKPWLGRALLVALTLNVVAGGGVAYLRREMLAPGPLTKPRDVVIAPAPTEAIARTLAERGVIASPLLFRVSAFITRRDGPLHAAEFGFPAHASISDVLSVLRAARPVQHRVTIPEGLTAKQIVTIVSASDAMTGDATITTEAAVLPQTYAFERGTTRQSVIDRAHAAMTAAVDQAWAGRDHDLPLASSVQAVTLASLVERETARPSERAHVAAVFLNRLRLGMKLQSDPTVVYAASDGTGVLGRALTRTDLDRDDPYNTYRVAGLPPGPICAPGLSSLEATLHPDASDDLFFVAEGGGGHAFARTLADHQRNVARWRAGVPG